MCNSLLRVSPDVICDATCGLHSIETFKQKQRSMCCRMFVPNSLLVGLCAVCCIRLTDLNRERSELAF
jgi:hypothetical protein